MYSHAFLDMSKDTLVIPYDIRDLGAYDSEPFPPEPLDMFNDNVLADKTFEQLKFLAIDKRILWDLEDAYAVLTKFRDLEELTIIWHDLDALNNDAEHELWKIRSPSSELVELDDTFLTEELLGSLPGIFQDLKAKYPDWHPKIGYKTVSYGCHQCCFNIIDDSEYGD